MGRPWVVAGLAVHALVAGAYLLLAVLAPDSPGDRSVLSCLLLLEAAVFAAGCALATAAKTSDDRARSAWRLLAAGCLAWSLAQVLWTWLEVFDAEPPMLLGVSGLGYAALPLLALPALPRLVRSAPVERSLHLRVLGLLDLTALAGAVIVLGWGLALERALHQDRVFPVLFGVGDVVIAIAVLGLLVRHRGNVRRPLQLVATGLVLVATTDITYVGQALEGRYVTGTWLDVGWMGGFLLVASAACMARQEQEQRPDSRAAKRVQLLLPYVPVALAVAVTVSDLWHGRGTGPVVMALVLLVVVVASVRQGVTLVQNADLIDELAARQVDLRRRALEDPLTGLGNRALLLERLETALADIDGPTVSLLYIDLDDFKLINDTHGHDAGDVVLTEVGQRLAGLAKPRETVARLGGDEFAVLLIGRSGEDFAARLLEELRRPVQVGARRFTVNGSIGLVRAEAADETARTLLSHVDIAMYAAKGAGKGRVAAVHGADRAQAVRKTRVREMVAHPELADLRVLYQPVVDLRNGQVRGVEALVRWHPAEIGEVPPADFIHLAEQAGSIGVIGEHVLRTALRDLADWQSDFPERRVAVGVNVSPLQLADDHLLGVVAQELARHGLRSDQLVLEITEEALVGDIDQASAAVAALRGLGVSVAIDDFGTGHSSFRYLDRFATDVLKIDRSFVAKIAGSERTRELVRSVAGLGRVLDVQTVAEGVETLEDLHLLREMGVELAQGFLFSRPVTKQEITALLAAGGCYPLHAAIPAPRTAAARITA